MGKCFLCWDGKLNTVFAITFNLLLSFSELVVSETDLLISKDNAPNICIGGERKACWGKYPVGLAPD